MFLNFILLRVFISFFKIPHPLLFLWNVSHELSAKIYSFLIFVVAVDS